MGTIHTLNPQPEQQEQPQAFQPRLNADVRPEGTVFQLQHTPIDIRLTYVPNDLMAQVVALWLEQHPSEAIPIIKDVREKIKLNAEIMHTIQATKH